MTKSFNQTYVPDGWIRTSREDLNDPQRASWPEVMRFDDNFFDMSIEVWGDLRDVGYDEALTLKFTHGNNEITLCEETSYGPRRLIEPLSEIHSQGDTTKERMYTMKVVDHETNSVAYYDVKLARVEIEKKEDKELQEKRLEVIEELDDEDENPFNVKFDTPENN